MQITPYLLLSKQTLAQLVLVLYFIRSKMALSESLFTKVAILDLPSPPKKKKKKKKYPAHKLEFLALKWCFTEKFHEYLYDNEFLVRTDNNPLTYVTTTAKLDATQHKWLAELTNYNFNIEYRSGMLMQMVYRRRIKSYFSS